VPPTAPAQEPVVISGAGLGLPGVDPMFDDANIARILDAASSSSMPTPGNRFRDRSSPGADHPTGQGGHQGRAASKTIEDEADVVKLAGQRRAAGRRQAVRRSRQPATPHLTRTTRMALGAGSTRCAMRASRW
jgi:hypothetical protein